MSHDHTIEFRIRSFYPNFFSLTQALNQPDEGCPAVTGEDLRKPELEFRRQGEKVFHELPLSAADVLILNHSDRQKAHHYLDLLITPPEENPYALEEKHSIRTNYLEKLKQRMEKLAFTENMMVVPSCTPKPYDDIMLSQKGKVLLDLYREGYPVPDFCTLTSNSYQLDESEREACLLDAISNLEKMTGENLGGTDKPLIFALRSATPFYIPGVMPTYLNVGVTKASLPSLENHFGKEVAWKIYLNNLQNTCQILAQEHDFQDIKKGEGVPPAEEIEARICRLFSRIESVDERALYDAHYQTSLFMKSSHDFFKRNQDLIYTFQRGHLTYPALILQKMVWTVRNKESYPGVLYSRHPRTGLGMQIESVRGIFGEDIMTGTVHAEQREYFNRHEIKEEFPAIYHFTPILPKLEEKLKSPATIEFAVESFEGTSFFALLQLNMSELTGRSTLLTAIDLYQKKIISKERVINLIRPYHLRQIFSERIDDASLKSMILFGTGVSVLPRSAVSARLYFTMAKALEAKKKGERVCLCKENFIPSETIFMGELDAILCMNPLAIHVVTACLGYGIPAFINLKNHRMKLCGDVICNDAGMVIHEGEWITVSSKNHCIYAGKASFKPARFQKYIEGTTLEMDIKEETVFINMAKAYKSYQEILSTLRTEEAMTLPDLVKLIRNDYDQRPEKAVEFVNGWFDTHSEYYYTEILKSGLGSHLDQHKIYNLLTTNRRTIFFRNVISMCRKEKLSGFTAGAFMLGRFLCHPHPIAFWRAFDPAGIAFMLNEYILFEKYMQVLSEFGERHLNRTRNKILTDDLNSIALSSMDSDAFLPLKLASPDWNEIEASLPSGFDKDSLFLIALLKQPYGRLFDYNLPWSLEKLAGVCIMENIAVPEADTV